MKKINIQILAILISLLTGCQNYLDPQIYDTVSPSNFWKTKDDARAGVFYLYGWMNGEWGPFSAVGLTVAGDMTTDDLGGVRAQYAFENFIWTPTQMSYEFYTGPIQTAVRANKVIDNLSKMESITPEDKELFIAEARAIRAYCYAIIYDFYGPSVLELSPDPDIYEKKSRASEQEFTGFIIKELNECAEILPEHLEFGRITKGAALTRLMKTYMVMTRFVDKRYFKEVAETAKRIMDMGVYDLEPSYANIWSLDNEGNAEVIWGISRIATQNGNLWLSHVLPYQYESPDGNPVQKWNVYRMRWPLADSYPLNDKRRKTFLVDIPVKSAEGEIVYEKLKDLDGAVSVGAIPFKYGEDPAANGEFTGHDEVIYRFSDVLLARAEALNELQGPNAESINLINQVRHRAGLQPVDLKDFSDKEALRNRVLQERQWELACEGVRRDDLIRHGLYAKNAFDRGAEGVGSPDDTHFDRWPIPQYVIDRNPNVKQNPGYH